MQQETFHAKTDTVDWTTAKPSERGEEAARLAAIGWTYQQIADELGYSGKGAAYKAAQRALVDEADKRRPPHDMLRLRENSRLDMLIKKAMEVMNSRHYATNNQGIIYAPTSSSDFLRDEGTGAIMRDENGNPMVTELVPLLDSAPTLDAIKTVLKVMERFAKMNGLDAPSKRQVITLDGIEAAIAELEESMQAGG